MFSYESKDVRASVHNRDSVSSGFRLTPVQMKEILNSLKACSTTQNLDNPDEIQLYPQSTLQRTVDIGGKIYDEDTGNALCEDYAGYLGKNEWEVSDEIGDWLWDMVRDANIFNFIDFAHLQANLVPVNGVFLNITGAAQVHTITNSRGTIHMTGSRTGDYAAAAAVSGYPVANQGYTWHHIEGINWNNATRNWDCDMILVATAYHGANHHVGAVWQYEQVTGNAYQP